MNSKEAKKLKKEVLEQLSKVVILLKGVKHEYEEDYDDDGNRVDNPKWYPENHFLSVAAKVCEDLSDGSENSETMEYYSSYCYWD